uniref:hypothetical protein n=1 Tax=Castellaniella defragrans TaxID=75697 RepID=UPI0033414AB5
MRRLIVYCIFASLAWSACPAQAQIRDVERNLPRSVGWHLGDVLDITVTVPVETGYQLDSSSLPRTGPLNYWLELRTINAQKQQDGALDRYRFTLQYQTFYAPLQARQRQIPGFTLRFVKEADSIQTDIPPWTFTMSPLREISHQASMELQPDAEPAPLAPDTHRIWITAALSLLFAMLLARHYAVPPFRRPRARPFTLAYRQLRRHLKRGGTYEQALILMHRAFDTAAGRCLMAGDIPAFVTAWPAISSLQSGIERFFAASQHQFFTCAASRPQDSGTAQAELLALAQALAICERKNGRAKP